MEEADEREQQQKKPSTQNDERMEGDQTEENSPSQQNSSQVPLVKKFYVFLNGNIHDAPRAIAWNHKQMRTWEVFLEHLTQQLKPRTGPIREVITPHGGRQVSKYEEFEPQGKYVAVPRGERFRQMDYENTPVHKAASNRATPADSRQKKDIIPVVHSRIQRNAKLMESFEKKSKTIFVFKNTDPFQRSIRILLKPSELASMNLVFQALEERVVLPQSRPMRKLFTVEGEEVEHPDDITDGGSYVAASSEPFQSATYGNALPPLVVKRVSHRPDSVKYLRHPPTASKQETRRTPRSINDADNEEGSSKDHRSETSFQSKGTRSSNEKLQQGQDKKTNQVGSREKPPAKKSSISSTNTKQQEDVNADVEKQSSPDNRNQSSQGNQTPQSKAR